MEYKLQCQMAMHFIILHYRLQWLIIDFIAGADLVICTPQLFQLPRVMELSLCPLWLKTQGLRFLFSLNFRLLSYFPSSTFCFMLIHSCCSRCVSLEPTQWVKSDISCHSRFSPLFSVFLYSLLGRKCTSMTWKWLRHWLHIHFLNIMRAQLWRNRRIGPKR